MRTRNHIVLLAWVAMTLIFFRHGSLLRAQVIINEWMAVNETFIRDAEGDFSGWLELRNLAPKPVDLSGWRLSIYEAWTIPAGTVIDAGGYLVLWASGKNRTVDGELHMSFAIPAREWDPSSRAPKIRLWDAGENVISEVRARDQEEDEAHGWVEIPDGSIVLVDTRPPTPGSANVRLEETVPRIVSPSCNGLLDSREITFDWGPLAVATAEEYFLDVGRDIVTVRGQGELFSRSLGRATSAVVRGIPLDGSRVYATLWTRIGEFWLRSVESYGTTSRELEFRRGDSNDDGRVDVSDALFVLAFLFRGVGAPACLDAADGNDDGEIDVSDSVFLLTFLFLGRGPLPPPGLACGVDPSSDALDCAHSTSTSC